jgi:hypothetical protein
MRRMSSSHVSKDTWNKRRREGHSELVKAAKPTGHTLTPLRRMGENG